jgi:hypothetical protein
MGWHEFSIEEAKKTGYFTNEEIGYIEKWSNDGFPFVVPDYDGFTNKEKAIYDRFTDAYFDWDKFVATAKGTVDGKGKDVPYEGFNPDTDYVHNPDSSFTPPAEVKEYKGGDGKGGNFVVTTEAIEHFRRQLDLVAPQGENGLIWQAIKKLDGIDLKPGTFGKAVRIEGVIDGTTTGTTTDGGLKGNTRDFLVNFHEALFDLNTNLGALIREYDSAEEFNKLTGEQLDGVLSEAWGDVQNLGGNGEDK